MPRTPAPSPVWTTSAPCCPPRDSVPSCWGCCKSTTWGWAQPKDSPVEPFGFSLTMFVIAGGAGLLWGFVAWSRHREATGLDPLVHLDLVKVPPLRSGLVGLFSQNVIMMGVFFVVPLYLQLVLGLDALDTGIKMLPVSITMFLASAAGSRLSSRFPVRTIVRSGSRSPPSPCSYSWRPCSPR